MIIGIKNISKIKNAEVEIDGITVIAGENNSGKSTVGKVLYTILDEVYECKGNTLNDDLYNRLENEFGKDIRNFNSGEESKIIYNSDGLSGEVIIGDTGIESNFKGDNFHYPIYLDDPHILDFPYNLLNKLEEVYPQHRINIMKMVKPDDKESEFEAKIVNKIADSIGNGRLKLVGDKLFFEVDNRYVDIKNTSAGVKVFLIILALIKKRLINDKTVLILDEPEVHLHPKWQVDLAIFLVYLYKELGTNILLNTHSPYLINAIEVYADKENVTEHIRYYLAENEEGGSVIKEETQNMDVIYRKLVEPFMKLEEEAYKDEGNIKEKY